ncbi:DUF262 domain-containing protein [Archangium violaceum]|uniref:DUF262 domain-containing protein n=1 Tax=Archangium violaceum TaxID=83451 RepID=UPI0036D7D11B
MQVRLANPTQDFSMNTPQIIPESFEPTRKTLGTILSFAEPQVLRVPPYQRHYSWEDEQVKSFWDDLVAFRGRHPGEAIQKKFYFLGAAVLVNTGSEYLILDGQQRLSTATILLAAMRDVIRNANRAAADQVQNQYLLREDYFKGKKNPKLLMNDSDRDFFRQHIQEFSDAPPVAPKKTAPRSHHRIAKAYRIFRDRLEQGWIKARSKEDDIGWIGGLLQALTENMALVAVTATDEDSAASIFETLNDRGIGLSVNDLLRSWVLSKVDEEQRADALDFWNKAEADAGQGRGAGDLIRRSWVSTHGDVKARSLYRTVKLTLEIEAEKSGTALSEVCLDFSRRIRDDARNYEQLVSAEHEDLETAELWRFFMSAKATAAHATLLAAMRELQDSEVRVLTRALESLIVRHNIICARDRSEFETAVYEAAVNISSKKGLVSALNRLRALSPDEQEFSTLFAKVYFKKQQAAIAQHLLRRLEARLSTSEETFVAQAKKVHLEHIYPQQPTTKWEHHADYVDRLGNLTLLAQKLNSGASNKDFNKKKSEYYSKSVLKLNEYFKNVTTWGPAEIEARQEGLAEFAQQIWPKSLVSDP